ncbi:MAG: efflux RND transporter periplasmic adaptor subunit [Deltaproteobacteria bacterium]|nr:efflux RND transporter periplasmic adaptor subunit [Deltaproteobacteria bacterium]MBW2394905.1 efflux RND transporter periplasmic adaptor subunit [Deltaproteobacteria bacterium]
MNDSANSQTASGRARWIFLAAAGLLLVGTFALYSFAPEPQREAAAGVEATAVRVGTWRIEPQLLFRTTRLSGVIEARRRVELFAEVGGRVIELGAEDLEAVEAGQLLVKMDPLLAEVAVERASAAVARAESQLSLAESERARFESLATRDAASASRRDQAVNGQKVAAANLREARANLSEARDQLAKKTLFAPFAGALQGFPVEKGEVLQPGESVGELLDLSTARLALGVTDREIVALRAGASVTVELEAYPGETLEGRILHVGAAADTTSRKFPIEVEIDNPGQRILPGMVARVELKLGEPRPVRLIPRDASLDQFGVRLVYVIEAGEKGPVARQRRIEARGIPFRPEDLEIVSGLEDGEEIVTTGLGELRDGLAVKPRKPLTTAGDASAGAPR